MTKKLTARDRFRAVFKHDTAELDRLPMLSLGMPAQGLFFQNWEKTIGNDLPDNDVRLTYFGDKTMQKWINSEWHNIGLSYPQGYPSVQLPKDRPEWTLHPKNKGDNPQMSIGWNGSIHLSGKSIHNTSYGWYVNGYFTRQKTEDGKVLAPWEVREAFYAKHGEPWNDKFAPGPNDCKQFQKHLKWYEENYNNFSEQGFSDFALMSGVGGLFEGTWEGMGSGTPAMGMMLRQYPKQLRTWLGQVKTMALKSVKLQYELAEEVGAQIDFMWFWDDSGQKGRPIIDPKYHKEFWVPLYKEVCDYVHKHKGHVIIHSCGFGETLVPNWIEAGIDAWQTIERAALNEPASIRKQFGNKIILIGAVDASNTVSFAKPNEVTEHVKQTMKDAVFKVEDASYVPGFTHDLLDCPVENVRAAVDAMLKYGSMPELKKLKK
jgi:hypothetical protein